jgi:hypothetical protein
MIMLTWTQRLAVRGALRLLRGAGIKAWFDVRLLRDSSKDFFGTRIGKRSDDYESLLQLIEEKRTALRPEFRFELRMYAELMQKRGIFMGVELTGRAMGGNQFAPPKPTEVDLSHLPTLRHGDRLTVEIKGDEVLGAQLEPAPGTVLDISDAGALEPGEKLVDAEVEQVLESMVVGTATEWKPSAFITRKLTAKASGEALPPGDFHKCNSDGPMRQRDEAGPFLPTCTLCGDINAEPA